MDVLSPECMWIGKRCYRINETIQSSANDKQHRYAEDGKYKNKLEKM
jgi:hypothetical protein